MAKDRRLSDDETALWRKVAGTATPLSPAKSEAPEPPTPASKVSKRQSPEPAGHATSPVPASPRRPEGIDRRTARRIARGSIAVDGRLDLHGLTQAEAHERLLAFLADAQADGQRLILVITGKGGTTAGERGVLRRAFPQWLASPRFRRLVARFDEAHRSHGGSGAFYVQLKRAVRE